jgi:hypothetical protein
MYGGATTHHDIRNQVMLLKLMLERTAGGRNES